MSLQPLSISNGRKFAAGLAGILTMVSIGSGWSITALSALLLDRDDTSDPLFSKLLFLVIALASALVFVIVCQLLMRAALGRIRTGGSLTRFFRYQLAALGIGGGLGLGLVPAMYGASPAGWVISITAGIALIIICLFAFRPARCPILENPPRHHIGLAAGVVVDHWLGGSSRSPSLNVIRFTDESGRQRWARHLVRQGPSLFGTRGQVQYDRHRPERVLRFAVTHQLFDFRAFDDDQPGATLPRPRLQRPDPDHRPHRSH